MMTNTPSQGIIVVEECGAITLIQPPKPAPAQKPKPSTAKEGIHG